MVMCMGLNSCTIYDSTPSTQMYYYYKPIVVPYHHHNRHYHYNYGAHRPKSMLKNHRKYNVRR